MIVIDGIVFSLQRSGGISIYFSEIISRLKSNEVKHKVLIGGNKNYHLKDYNLHGDVNLDKWFWPGRFSRYFKVKTPSNTKIFHSSYYRLPLVNENIKVVTTVHDFTYEKWGHGLSAKIHHWQKRKAILGSDVIVCISENTKQDLLHFIPEASSRDIRVIYNGVSDDFKKIQTTLDNARRSVLYVGARSGYKNFEMLVEAMRELQNYKLVVVGSKLTEQELTFLDRTIPGRFEEKSFVSNEQLNIIYNEAHCLVYPSLYEGFGIPPLEAMRAGCPVIASNSSSLPEVCGSAAILLDDISAEKIKNAIVNLNDEEVRSEFIRLGFLNSAKFSWDNTYREIYKVYRGLK